MDQLNNVSRKSPCSLALSSFGRNTREIRFCFIQNAEKAKKSTTFNKKKQKKQTTCDVSAVRVFQAIKHTNTADKMMMRKMKRYPKKKKKKRKEKKEKKRVRLALSCEVSRYFEPS